MPDFKNPAQSASSKPSVFSDDLIRLNAAPKDREEAIRMAGQILVDAGAAESPYIASMAAREAEADTWLGSGIAIPHGKLSDKHYVKTDSVAVLQIPQGVKWSGEETAYLVFGIAAQGDGHLAVLRRLTRLLQNPENLQTLFTTADKSVIRAALSDNGGSNMAAAAEPSAVKDLPVTAEWILDYPSGLHARPSSIWINAARQAGIALQVRKENQISNLKGLVSLLQLGAKCGDTLVFSAEGENAEQKLQAFMQTVRSLSAGEKEQTSKAEKQHKQALSAGWQPPSGAKPIIGVAAAPGLAIGAIHVLRKAVAAKDVENNAAPASESALLLQKALTATRRQLKIMADDVARRIGVHDAGIFEAQADLLDDEQLLARSVALMLTDHGAAKAWVLAVEEAAESLEKGDSPVLKARAADLRDVGRRVLGNIDSRYELESALPAAAPASASERYILVAEDLSPSDTANLDKDHICGLSMIEGGPTSHMAILARTMGLPAMVAAGAPLKIAAKNGVKAILNGNSGALWLNPQESDIAAAYAEIKKNEAEKQKQEEQSSLPATTPDGQTIMIAANVNTPEQAAFAMRQGAEGVGLMRTEFLFLEREQAPDEQEQYEIYKAMSAAVGDAPLIIRALDIGGDKQVDYLRLPHEDNPFLGVRGARLLLRRTDLLYPQLRALYRAAKDSEFDNFSVMFPMIMAVDEVIRIKETAERIRSELSAPKIKLGIMVEVPSAALCADKLAKYVDFFSIGTNDLTQYTLAADRQSPVLAAQADSLHPAVLRMIAQTIAGAKLYNRSVGVCGGVAADPFGAVLLVGLGVHELSMTPSDIAAVKARLRATPFSLMQDLAKKACDLESAAQVRALNVSNASHVSDPAASAAPAQPQAASQ